MTRTKKELISETCHKPIRCSKVEISDTAIRELDGSRPAITVPRVQIHHIKLCYDTSSKNPFCQYFLGFTLFSLGLIGLIAVFVASLGGAALLKSESSGPALPLIPVILWIMVGAGLWLLIGIFQARYHLVIDTDHGIRRFFFEKSTGVREIEQFIRTARLYFGYDIEMSVLEKKTSP